MINGYLVCYGELNGCSLIYEHFVKPFINKLSRRPGPGQSIAGACTDNKYFIPLALG